jgi:hypothetical protein
MRRSVWAWTALALVGLSSTASAQVGSPMMGGVSPSQIISKPIDLTNVIAPLPTFTTQTRFTFSNFFHRINPFSASPTLGTSALPAPSSFPSTRYPNMFQPKQPILSVTGQ